jgi:hypothetical protein
VGTVPSAQSFTSPSPFPSTATTPTTATTAVSGPVPATASTERDLGAWRAILDRIRQSRPGLASIFEHAIPLEVGAARVLLGFEPSAAFLAARASEPEALEEVTREIRAHFGGPTQVALDLAAKPMGGVRTVASLDAEVRAQELAKARAAVEGHPIVREAVRLFGAQIRDVKLPGGEG